MLSRIVLALMCIATVANCDLLDTYKKQLIEQERQKRQDTQTTITTDGSGNINLNTKVNADVVVNRREVTQIKISDLMNDIKSAQSDIESMKNNAALYTSAQTFVQNLVSKVQDDLTSIKVDNGKFDVKLDGLQDDVDDITKNLDDTLDDLKDTVDNKLDAALLKMDKAIEAANATAIANQRESIKLINDAKTDIFKEVNASLKGLDGIGEVVNASSLYFPKPYYQLIAWTKTPTNARGNGRIFYKVDFNPGSRGFFRSDRRELFQACNHLSKDLQERDGIDRALKPACDNPSHCDGNAVSLPNSYLSHTGCGNYDVNDRGYGLPHSFVSGVLMYNRVNSWSGCRMLQHRGTSCSHAWVDCWGGSTYKASATLCTGSNNNYKQEPK